MDLSVPSMETLVCKAVFQDVRQAHAVALLRQPATAANMAANMAAATTQDMAAVTRRTPGLAKLMERPSQRALKSRASSIKPFKAPLKER